MQLENVHEETLRKFQALHGEILVGREPIKGTQASPKVPKDQYVSKEHILHDLIRGFYKPAGKSYLLSYLATESDDNYGQQIKWIDKDKFLFSSIIMRPPSGEKDNRKFSDIAAARYNLEHGVPLGVLFRVEKRHNAILGLGKIVKEDNDGNFLIEPYSFKERKILNLPITIFEDFSEFENIPVLIDSIYFYIQSKGFNYSLPNIKNLYLSLRSKPFVIISGISGTGKTKIVQLFAESVGATEDNGQFKLIPVRPDWSDSSELLGYLDLKGEFQKGPLTEVVEHAMDHPNLPHFVLLDEMNLARVEYYFSDVLSVMESRKRDGDQITSSQLLDAKYTGRAIKLPNNLYLVGTVNMDETTHPFSKKVLDRANTIEFNEINLNSFNFLESREEVEAQRISNEQLEPCYISLKDVYSKKKLIVEEVSQRLAEINKYLEPINAHVGYRVRDEICFYMVHNENAKLLEKHEAFDFCVMQKILPRITGSDGRIEQLLQNLFTHFTDVPYNVENIALSPMYPRSAKKVAEMLRRYHTDGFTSFWVS